MTLAEDIAYLDRLADRVSNGEEIYRYQLNNATAIRLRLQRTNGPREYIELAKALEYGKLPNY